MPSESSKKLQYIFKGIFGSLIIDDESDYLTITRGKTGKIEGLPESKKIYYKDIKAIQLKQPHLTSGYIQIITDDNKIANNAMEADDENTVFFEDWSFGDGGLDFIQAKELIEKMMSAYQKTKK